MLPLITRRHQFLNTDTYTICLLQCANVFLAVCLPVCFHVSSAGCLPVFLVVCLPVCPQVSSAGCLPVFLVVCLPVCFHVSSVGCLPVKQAARKTGRQSVWQTDNMADWSPDKRVTCIYVLYTLYCLHAVSRVFKRRIEFIVHKYIFHPKYRIEGSGHCKYMQPSIGIDIHE